MLKFYSAILISMVSFGALAHGHHPTEHKEYLTSTRGELKITLSNGYKEKMCYGFELDGNELTPLQVCLNGKEQRELNFPVFVEPDVKKEFTFCSLSGFLGDGSKVRTRQCTEAVYLYPKTMLEERKKKLEELKKWD